MIRVIATLLIDPARGVIKGKQFAHDRVIGEPIQWARVMSQLREVDEMVVLDITHGPPDLPLFERIAAECTVPVAYGGGIHDWETAKRLLRAGADKLVFTHRDLMRVVADRAGSQAVVACVNHEAEEERFHCGLAAVAAVEQGAGEVLIQDKTRDGMLSGYNLAAVSQLRFQLKVPLIASSGAGTTQHFVEAVKAGADAVAAGAAWAFTDLTPNDVKRALHEAGYPVRLMEAV